MMTEIVFRMTLKGVIYHISVRTNIYWIQLDYFFYTQVIVSIEV